MDDGQAGFIAGLISWKTEAVEKGFAEYNQTTGDWQWKKIEKEEDLRKQRDDLLDALCSILPFIPTTTAKEGGAPSYSSHIRAADKVRAAIANAKGGE